MIYTIEELETISSFLRQMNRLGRDTRVITTGFKVEIDDRYLGSVFLSVGDDITGYVFKPAEA